MNLSRRDRLESLKAGLFAAIPMAAVDVPVAIAMGVTLFDVMLRLAVVGASGFLFGVTYRYAVRNDANPHLKSGVVGAFGLVRGLAQLEGRSLGEIFTAIAALSVFETLGLFALAGVCLDLALQRGWIGSMENGGI